MKFFSRNEYFRENEQFYIHLQTGGNYQIHTHDFIEIVYIIKGSAMHRIGNSEYLAKRGTLLFVNCGQTHSFSSSHPLVYYNLMLTPEFISDQLVDSGNLYEILSLSMFEEFQQAQQNTKPLAQLSGEAIPEMDALFSALLREYQKNEPGRSILIRSYLNAVLTHIFRSLCKQDEEIIISMLQQYIEEHCSERLTLNDLSKKCFYHPSYFSRMFREKNGMTLTDYISKIRIQKAIGLLETTGLSVEEVQISCGMSDKTFFYKKFREETGLSPAEFRKKLQK